MQSILGAILEDFPSAAAPAAPPPPPLSYTWQTLPIAIFELCSAPNLYMLSAHHNNAAALQINTIRQCSVFFFAAPLSSPNAAAAAPAPSSRERLH